MKRRSLLKGMAASVMLMPQLKWLNAEPLGITDESHDSISLEHIVAREDNQLIPVTFGFNRSYIWEAAKNCDCGNLRIEEFAYGIVKVTAQRNPEQLAEALKEIKPLVIDLTINERFLV